MPRTKSKLPRELRCADVGDFNLGKRVEIWLPFESPQGPPTDGILVTEIDVVVGDGEGKVGHRDTHQVGGLVTGGN